MTVVHFLFFEHLQLFYLYTDIWLGTYHQGMNLRWKNRLLSTLLLIEVSSSVLQEVISNHKEPVASSYGRLDTGLRSSYSQLGSSSYPSSSLPSQPYSGYGSSGLGGYSTFRLWIGIFKRTSSWANCCNWIYWLERMNAGICHEATKNSFSFIWYHHVLG